MGVVYWSEVAGVKVPWRIGGHPALDFCNTWAGWGGPLVGKQEWLRDYDAFAAWTLHAELIDSADLASVRRSAPRDPEAAAEILGSARRLRTAVHTAVLDPADESAMATVTGYVRKAGAVIRLRPGTEPGWQLPGPAKLATPLLAVSWAAGELLTTQPLDRVRVCPGDVCGWLFLDRTGRRRWCSMSTCGNRAKVRAHATRVRSAPDSDASSRPR